MSHAADYEHYPEFPAANRISLALDWIPAGCRKLLDAGCSHGYATRLFSARSGQTHGIDPEERSIAIARERYPDLHFHCSGLESTPFADAEFDTIILTDVFEHVEDEIASLNELYRILAPGGSLIVTTPHAGLFSLLDPYNYGYYLRRFAPWLYSLIKQGSLDTTGVRPGYQHRHYTLGAFRALFERSRFKGNYTFAKVFRSGLLLHPLELNAAHALEKVTSARTARKLSAPLALLSEGEYWIPFGPLAYNIALLVHKRG